MKNIQPSLQPPENGKAMNGEVSLIDMPELTNEIIDMSNKGHQHAIEIGNRLLKIRNGKVYRQFGHNSFKEFVQKEMPFSLRTAYNYINLSKIFDIASQPNRTEVFSVAGFCPVVEL